MPCSRGGGRARRATRRRLRRIQRRSRTSSPRPRADSTGTHRRQLERSRTPSNDADGPVGAAAVAPAPPRRRRAPSPPPPPPPELSPEAPARSPTRPTHRRQPPNPLPRWMLSGGRRGRGGRRCSGGAARRAGHPRAARGWGAPHPPPDRAGHEVLGAVERVISGHEAGHRSRATPCWQSAAVHISCTEPNTFPAGQPNGTARPRCYRCYGARTSGRRLYC